MKFFIRKIIKYFLGLIGFMINLFKTNKNEILILMYHRVNDEIKKELSVKKNSFKWHMKYLINKNFKVISINEAIEKIIKNEINDRYVVLTFDDGYDDYYYNAFPVLKKYDFKSILYIVSEYVGQKRKFWWDKDLEYSELLDWNKIKELIDSNLVDIGSHTCNHIDLKNLDIKEMEYEIIGSKNNIENKLGIVIEHFAYPRGIYSKQAEEIIVRNYKSAVLIEEGLKIDKKFNINNIYKLKRIPIQRSDGKYLFILRLNNHLFIEEKIKKVINKIRSIK